MAGSSCTGRYVGVRQILSNAIGTSLVEPTFKPLILY
jgi:hypothetical protein